MPFISFEVDEGLNADIQKAVKAVGDTDRSKFIRIALRERIRLVLVPKVGRPPKVPGKLITENEES
jgi:hypothetical protein